ncbi:hypothetical protein [Marinobacter sp.]|uniref:hypothetical protein n=1 Tax=Marinobacter sp. TaxID=50741 RepID=UPI000C8E92AB|nr:hypothetical protein [Marinobacter sp.]MAB53554.1 hypothetical protein [Marinobacter sp.]
MSENITTPVGRFVYGSIYDPNKTDYDGNPLVTKTGPNAGQPRVEYILGLAIPKGAETHWAHTEWGKKIWEVGCAAFPSQSQREDFSWKILDGDSTKPNKKGNVPSANENFRGCWVLKASSGYPPSVFNSDGSQQISEIGAVKPGYYIQINMDVDGNKNTSNPGVYLNHRMVALSGYGEEIRSGMDPKEAGFGQSALPAGASATPVGGGFNPAPAPTSAAPTPTPTPTPTPPTPVTPHPGILQPPAAPARNMTAAATATYDAYREAGWTDEQLVQHGLMLPA